jgi:arsenical pump membrane protein
LTTTTPLPILVFAVVVFLVLRQPVLKIPFTHKFAKRNTFRNSIKIDYGSAPIIGVLLLLLTSSVNGGSIINGIVGSETIKPYSILILFMSLAYICISLDLTGFFAYLALLTAKAAGNSGRKVFIYFFLLSSFLTVFTSNDIVILTMTPIIYYFARNTRTDPVPFLIAQFFAANIWSVALYIGNPTNIIVAQAYNLSFLEYSTWMLLPAIFAGVSCFVLLWWKFKKKVPEKVEAVKIDPKSALKDERGAYFGVVSLLACLLLLGLSSQSSVPLWLIPFFFAVVMAIRDVSSRSIVNKGEEGSEANVSSLTLALKRMPWKIVPFIIGFFIMVESLSYSGWVDLFASYLSGMSSNLLTAVLGLGFLSSFASNLMNNQPMTILFTKILQNPHFIASSTIEKGCMFALILGSNFGANFTLIGALAGIMWSKILLDKGVFVSFKEFAKNGFFVMPLVVTLACLALTIELLMRA